MSGSVLLLCSRVDFASKIRQLLPPIIGVYCMHATLLNFLYPRVPHVLKKVRGSGQCYKVIPDIMKIQQTLVMLKATR